MFASQHCLDNLNLIIDNNKISMLGFTNEIIGHGDLTKRLGSFGWKCWEVDGHDVLAVCEALHEIKKERNGTPKVLIANTIKGRGIPGLENQPLSHIINPKPDLLNQLISPRLKL
jgi:transketolase